MKPVPFYVLPREEVMEITSRCPIPENFLRDWERARPGILNDDSIDIFLPNSRSQRQRWTAYERFQRVPEHKPGIPVVCMSWLEILEAGGVGFSLRGFMTAVRYHYPDSPIVWSWNHDRDQAWVPELNCLPPHEFVVTYNTSKPAPQDILVPFWNVETRIDWEPKEMMDKGRMLRGCFLGAVAGVEVRGRIINAFRDKPGWEVHATRVPIEEYIGMMACSTFALCPRGGGLSSYRFFEAIQCGAIPVLFADHVALPYPDLNWKEFIVRLPEKRANDFQFITNWLDRLDVCEMQSKLASVRPRMGLAGVQEAIYNRLVTVIQ